MEEGAYKLKPRDFIPFCIGIFNYANRTSAHTLPLGETKEEMDKSDRRCLFLAAYQIVATTAIVSLPLMLIVKSLESLLS